MSNTHKSILQNIKPSNNYPEKSTDRLSSISQYIINI